MNRFHLFQSLPIDHVDHLHDQCLFVRRRNRNSKASESPKAYLLLSHTLGHRLDLTLANVQSEYRLQEVGIH